LVDMLLIYIHPSSHSWNSTTILYVCTIFVDMHGYSSFPFCGAVIRSVGAHRSLSCICGWSLGWACNQLLWLRSCQIRKYVASCLIGARVLMFLSSANVWKISTGQRIIYMTFQGRKKKKRSDLIVMELEGLTVDQRRMCGIHY
jgi:hypothetical protein